MKNIGFALFFSCLLLLFPSCTLKKRGLKVAATPVPQAEMLEFIKPDLAEQGINLIIVTTNNYNVPNRALNDKTVDANFFQHIPFMDEQIKKYHYKIESLGKIEIEPMGIYSKHIRSLSALPEHAVIAIPSDPTNEARALLLLQDHGIIQLRDPKNVHSTIKDVTYNPKRIRFLKFKANELIGSLPEVTAAAINTNFVLEAGLSPIKDSLALESKNSPYANIIAIRIGEGKKHRIQALKKAMTSEKMRQFILEKYNGAVLPAF